MEKQEHIFAGLAAVVGFFLLDSIFMSDSSPFHDYFLYHVHLPNYWHWFNLLPYIVGILAGGLVHQANPLGYYVAGMIQWFILGRAVSVLFFKFKTKRT